MANKIRLGIIGTSGWTEFMYYNSLNGYEPATLVAVCGRNQTATQRGWESSSVREPFSGDNVTTG